MCGRSFKSLEGANEHKRHCEQAVEVKARADEERRARTQAVVVGLEQKQEEDAYDSDSTVRPLPAGREARGRRGAEYRKSYSAMFKLRVLRILWAFREEHGSNAGGQRAVAEMFGLSESVVSKWLRRGNSA